MSNELYCPECESELPPNVPRGLCPRCTLADALHEDSSPSQPPLTSVHPFPNEGKAPGVEGRNFGDYEVQEEVARGGMGVVYKARQKSLDRLVAVKFLLIGPHASPDLIKRFRIEASAGAALRHPNIVAIHEVGVHEGEHFMVMDYVNGPNLARLARDQPLTPKRAARYLRIVAEAIHYAHEKDILHRDLKPSNVLIDTDDQPRVTDFGLAKRLCTDPQSSIDLDPLTQSGQVLGSFGYMPPEQAIGTQGRVSRRSDVYSLGAMLYHLLTGRPPFGGGSVADTLRQVESQDPISARLLNPSVPGDLETICFKCLEKNPENRFTTALELAAELARFDRDEPIQSRPIGRPEKAWRWCRRNPVGTALIGTLALALAVSLALVGVLIREKQSVQGAMGIIRQLVERALNEDWERSDKASETILSEELAALMGRHKRAFGPEALRLRIGVSATEGPVVQARKYFPMLNMLEEKLKSSLGRPVALDLVLFKSRKTKDGLVATNVDLARMGILTFLHAQDVQSQLQPLVQIDMMKDCVIFARAEAGVTNLNQMTGHSFAFGDTNATLSLWAKSLLIGAGVRGRDLSRYAILDSQAIYLEEIREKGSVPKRQGDRTSHSEVINAVLAGEFDAGVARLNTVRDKLGKELVELRRFESEPNLWVARTGLPTNIVGALKATFLSLSPEELNTISNAKQGFREVDSASLDALRKMEKEAEEAFPNPLPNPGLRKGSPP